MSSVMGPPAGASTDPNDTYIVRLYAIPSVFASLATVAVILRFVSRHLKKAGVWWDDWTAVLAALFIWIEFAFIVQSVHHGKGRHRALLSVEDQTMVTYWSYWFSIFYTAIPATIKTSALLLYWRVFRLVDDRFSRCVKAMLVIVPLWGLSSVCLSAFGCSPISAFWAGHGKCINEHAWVLAFGVPNIVLDVVVWMMPIPRVWQMQCPVSQKLTLTAIFLLGLVDCALAIIRLAGSAESLGDWDTSYDWAPAMWWCVIHTSIGVVVICLPTMRILLLAAKHRMMRSFESKQSLSSSPPEPQMTKISPKTAREVGLSLSGETDYALHSNIIATALRHDVAPARSAEGIHVQREFTLAEEEAGLRPLESAHVRNSKTGMS